MWNWTVVTGLQAEVRKNRKNEASFVPFCWPAWRQGSQWRALGWGEVWWDLASISHLKVRHIAYAGHLELVWVVRVLCLMQRELSKSGGMICTSVPLHLNEWCREYGSSLGLGAWFFRATSRREVHHPYTTPGDYAQLCCWPPGPVSHSFLPALAWA